MGFLAYVFFYPTLLWNLALCRLRKSRRWWDWVDDSVLLGALPFEQHVPLLKGLGITAVINTCREYRGPVHAYAAAGMEQLRLPTTDFTPPTLDDIRRGVEFIQQHVRAGHKVYVHCKAGRGRSATVVLCYLLTKGLSPQAAQAYLLTKRPHVNRNLYRLEVVAAFARGV
jgi:atypical dual specificity phosphatase